MAVRPVRALGHGGGGLFAPTPGAWLRVDLAVLDLRLLSLETLCSRQVSVCWRGCTHTHVCVSVTYINQRKRLWHEPVPVPSVK